MHSLSDLMRSISAGHVTAVAAWAALLFYGKQAAASQRDHIANVYQLLFEKMDTPEMREARNYVYNHMESDSFKKEHWLNLDDECRKQNTEQFPRWVQHRGLAEIVARSFDQLGLLVREGVVPLNVVARFYASPAVRCWHNLFPYVIATRHNRKQDGHLWEWENLVLRVIVPHATVGHGIWKGLYDHDNLQVWFKKIEVQLTTPNLARDVRYRPRSRFWVVRPWYAFWCWGRAC